MTKREVGSEIAGVLLAILKDVEQAYPHDHCGWTRDSKRVLQGIQNRGWGFVAFDLPALADLALAGLRDGRLSSDRPAFGRSKSRSDCRPKFLFGLWSRLFLNDGLLQQVVDPTAVFFLLTITSVFKKIEIPCAPDRMFEVYREYYDIERNLPPSSLLWEDDYGAGRTDCGSLSDLKPMPLLSDVESRSVPSALLETCQKVADRISASLGYLEPNEVVGRHGPGAVSDMRSGRDKYSFPTWSDRLDTLFPFSSHGTLNEGFLWDKDGNFTLHTLFEEGASYLTDVPKTAKGPRLIAEEPTSNQWIQQGVSDVFRDAVKRTLAGNMIDFFDQTPNQDACRVASVTGSTATIDLSSASDRLSTWTVQRVFRSNLSILRMLTATRTRFLKQDEYPQLPPIWRLRKFASMGSALTFPVQSFVFAVLALGVGSYLNPTHSLQRLSHRVRVFGDDIILPNAWVVPFSSLLAGLGLKVNLDKSFASGFIRESCGLYAYKGYDVTPFRVRKVFSNADGASRASWARGSANAFLKGLWHTSKFMESCAFQGRQSLAVNVKAPQIGLPTYSSGLDPAAKLRWSKAFQCTLVSAWKVKVPTTTKEAEQDINALTELSRKSYTPFLIDPEGHSDPKVDPVAHLNRRPRRGSLLKELTEAIDGPGLLTRVWAPLELITTL